MMTFIKIALTAANLFALNQCFEIKTFYYKEKLEHTFIDGKSYTLVGDKNNKYYNVDQAVKPHPSMLKTSYFDTVRDIVLRNVDASKLTDIDKDAQIYVSMFFDPTSLKVIEVYFGFTAVTPLKFMTVEQLQKIDEDVKKLVRGERRIGWYSEQEINENFSKLKYIDGVGVSFYFSQIKEYKNGQIPKEKVAPF
ncbi:hypothetical protein QE382_003193 [Sphingobacterium zeae]|uniref:Lipoprotein n=1 Tax=Sphingobacterium zeae TaxID=1776859 RepID=A0ABU0U8S7_9SPHI|nr:hypothetical protein [Sphingobacterium zeae]MDQ1151209.1 hypothetical protein [Sphingobacterium zeae]